jgi:hypothetical protein
MILEDFQEKLEVREFQRSQISQHHIAWPSTLTLGKFFCLPQFPHMPFSTSRLAIDRVSSEPNFSQAPWGPHFI